VGKPDLLVNSFHREAILEVVDRVIAIAAPSQRFAVGLQWHQKLFAGADHPGSAILAGLVEAAGSKA
jgi:putative glutamine amidotransferase